MRPRTALFLTALIGALTGCANQRDTIPMLHVQPGLSERAFYFEKRALAMFPELAKEEPAEGQDDVVATAPAECAKRTWGAPMPETTCDSGRNE